MRGTADSVAAAQQIAGGTTSYHRFAIVPRSTMRHIGLTKAVRPPLSGDRVQDAAVRSGT